jgi:periplasmic divalent cation tolerance protein
VAERDKLEVVSVTTTVGSAQAARLLARRIIDNRLAACVQLDEQLTSLYRWNGELCEEPEVQLVMKTLPACVAALQALFVREHPYELPQFLVVSMQASPAYAAWVRSEVGEPPAPGGAS